MKRLLLTLLLAACAPTYPSGTPDQPQAASWCDWAYQCNIESLTPEECVALDEACPEQTCIDAFWADQEPNLCAETEACLLEQCGAE